MRAPSARVGLARSEARPAPTARSREAILAAAVPALLALAVYLTTVARDIVTGDTPEFVTVALTLGVSHPPGYPLLTLLGALFGLVPLDPPPFRVNLLSAISAAGTVGVIGLIGHRLTSRWLPSAAAALVLGTSGLFWHWSLVAETFPLNGLLAALLLYLLISWHLAPQRGRLLVLAALCAGLGLANQQTIVLLAPAVAYLLLRRRAALAIAPLGAAVAFAAGLLPYLYLPWAAGRHPYLNWGDISSLGDLAGHLLRVDYGTGQLVTEVSGRGGDPLARLVALLISYGPLQGGLVIVGAIAAYRQHRWLLWTTALAFIASGPAFALYANANMDVPTSRFLLERFFLLPQVATAPLLSIGAVALAGVTVVLMGKKDRVAEVAIALAVATAVGAQVALGYAAADQSQNRVARVFAEDILATLEPGTIFLAAGDHVILPIAYLQAVEDARPDVTLVIVPLLPAEWYRRHLRARHPDLALPAGRYDGPDRLKTLVEANPARPMAMSGEEPGATFGGAYGTYPRGLSLKVVPATARIDLATVAAENATLYERYRPPRLSDIKAESFDRFVVAFYALPAYRVGRQFEIARQTEQARAWYERALAIDPALSEAREALARLSRR